MINHLNSQIFICFHVCVHLYFFIFIRKMRKIKSNNLLDTRATKRTGDGEIKDISTM